MKIERQMHLDCFGEKKDHSFIHSNSLRPFRSHPIIIAESTGCWAML